MIYAIRTRYGLLITHNNLSFAKLKPIKMIMTIDEFKAATCEQKIKNLELEVFHMVDLSTMVGHSQADIEKWEPVNKSRAGFNEKFVIFYEECIKKKSF